MEPKFSTMSWLCVVIQFWGEVSVSAAFKWCAAKWMRTLVEIQFRSQAGTQMETADETIHRQFLCNAVFIVYDLQNQLSLRLLQPLDELPVATLDFSN